MNEANVKRLPVYDSNYLVFWKMQIYGDSQKISAVDASGRVERGINRQITEDF